MKNRTFPLLAFLLATLLASIAIAPSSRAAAADTKWLRLSSEHFDMMSCVSENDSKAILVKLEQCRAAILDCFPTAPAYDPRVMIFVSDNKGQFEQLGLPYPQTVGAFGSGDIQPRFLMVNGSIDGALPEFFRKYALTLLTTRFKNWIPLWFTEGVTDFLSTIQVNGDVVTLGNLGVSRRVDRTSATDYASLLTHTPLLPMDKIIEAKATDFYYSAIFGDRTSNITMKGNPKRQLFYAQSWLAVHYLICGAKNGAPVTPDNLVDYLNMSSPTPAALKRYLGFTYAELDDALNSYLHDGKLAPARIQEPAQPLMAKITSRPATELEYSAELIGLGLSLAKTQLERQRYLNQSYVNRLSQLKRQNELSQQSQCDQSQPYRVPGQPGLVYYPDPSVIASLSDRTRLLNQSIQLENQFNRDRAYSNVQKEIPNEYNEYGDLKQLVEKYPDDPRTHELLFEAALSDETGQNRPAALGQCLKAIQLGSANPLIYLWYLRRVYADTATSPDYILPDQASANYRAVAGRLIQLAPDCTEAYKILATVEAHSRDISQPAAQIISAALPNMSNYDKCTTLCSLGTIYWRLKDYPKAEECLIKALAERNVRRTFARDANQLLARVLQAEGKPVPPSKFGPSPATKTKAK